MPVGYRDEERHDSFHRKDRWKEINCFGSGGDICRIAIKSTHRVNY